MINATKADIPEIEKLKNQINSKFYQLKLKLISEITYKQQELMKWLNSFLFSHLNGQIRNIHVITDIL